MTALHPDGVLVGRVSEKLRNRFYAAATAHGRTVTEELELVLLEHVEAVEAEGRVLRERPMRADEAVVSRPSCRDLRSNREPF